jgi:hypothetical protein
MTRKIVVFRYFADFRDAGARAMCPPKMFNEFSEACTFTGLQASSGPSDETKEHANCQRRPG